MICQLLGHKFGKHPDKISNQPCDRWDNCNIEEHRIDIMYWICKRCSFVKKKRFSNGDIIQ